MSSRPVRELPPPPRAGPPPLCPHVGDHQMPAEQSGRLLKRRCAESSPWVVSFAVHSVALFLLGLITCSVQTGNVPLHLIAYATDAGSAAEDIGQEPWLVESDWREGAPTQDQQIEPTPVDVPFEAPQVVEPKEAPNVADDAEVTDSGEAVEPTESEPSSETPSGGGLEGRGRDARVGLAGQRGGNQQSEEAVERGLRWLAAHQRDDGSWCFDLNKPPCNGLCRNPGTEASTTAATGLALLPFLGAGYTHLDGEHAETVKRGLYYLVTQARVTPQGVDLRDSPTPGAMYGQAMATIVLCEAYAITRDATFKDVAQQAIRFIVLAQNEDGGWRYTPGEPGDTTVTGWQLMAMKSAQLAKLDVPSPTIDLVPKFLDSVQFEGGARYGYTTPTPRAKTHEATTAVGLLCRMYTGWHRDNPALYQGVGYLHKWGPSETNMYYNYYAAQVLHHWEGPEWQTWNGRMRDYLVATQAKNSHEAGSWYFPDPYGDAGGRLYNTAIAVMTLEVYYRHLPLYGQEAIDDRH